MRDAVPPCKTTGGTGAPEPARRAARMIPRRPHPGSPSRGAGAVGRVGLLGRSEAGSCPNLPQRHPGPGSTARRSPEYQRFSSGTPARSGPLQQILDNSRRRGHPRAPRMPLTDSRAAAARLGVKASVGISPDRLAGDNRRSGAPAVDDEDPPMKVIQWAHGGALLFGPFMCGWTTVLQPSFPRARRASRGPGRSGPRCQVGSSSASPSQRRRAPRSARSSGNRRARHLTRENVC